MSQPSGNRIESLLVRCPDCQIPKFQEIEENREYCVMMSEFTAEGGDGFKMFKDERINMTSVGMDASKYIFLALNF